MPVLTQQYLQSILKYDPETGDSIWIVSKARRIKAGSIAGHIGKYKNGKKYIQIKINGKNYYAHRLAWMYMTGEFPPDQVDHEDGNGLNNKWNNLRCATNTENAKNRRLRKDNTTGVCGVYWSKQYEMWHSKISIDGDSATIGFFPIKKDAINARKLAEIQNGYHQNHGQDRPL